MFVLCTGIWNKKEKRSSIWENSYKLLKKKYFQALFKFKKKNVERVKENETNMEVFSVENKNLKSKKNWTKGKKILY